MASRGTLRFMGRKPPTREELIADPRPVGLYKRVSTGKQYHEGDSMEAQDDIGRRAIEREGLGDSEVIVFEDHKTGRNNNRPGMKDMLSWMEQGKLKAVFYYDMKRLAREKSAGNDILAAAYSGRCQLFSPLGRLPLEQPSGQLIADVEFAVGEYEINTTAIRVRDIMYNKVAPAVEGRPTEWAGGRVLYGYRRVCDETGKATLVPDPVQAPVLHEIFTLYADGMGANGICRRLNREGIPSPRAGQVFHSEDGTREWTSDNNWEPSTITNIIRNPRYRGTQEFGEVEGPWPFDPIIPVELAERAFERARRRTYKRGRNSVSNPLTSIALCAKCGMTLVRFNSKTKYPDKDGNVREYTYGYIRCIHQKQYNAGKERDAAIHLSDVQMAKCISSFLCVVAQCHPAPARPVVSKEVGKAALEKARRAWDRANEQYRDGDIDKAEHERCRNKWREEQRLYDLVNSQSRQPAADFEEAVTLRDVWDSLSVGTKQWWMSVLTNGVVVDDTMVLFNCSLTDWLGWPKRIYCDKRTGAVLRREEWD